MATIIIKYAGTSFIKKEHEFETIFENPRYLTLAYADGKAVNIFKFKEGNPINSIDAGWKKLESLKDHAALIFFEHKKRKIFERNEQNISPIRLRKDLVYMGVGDMLELTKPSKKEYSEIRFFKHFLFDEMMKACQNVFFTFPGKWLLHRIIGKAVMAFLQADGQISIVNRNSCDQFKGIEYFDTIKRK